MKCAIIEDLDMFLLQSKINELCTIKNIVNITLSHYLRVGKGIVHVATILYK